jgi:excisionase family DNA binding protein
MAQAVMDGGYVTVTEAARLLNVTPTTVRRRLKQGEMRWKKAGVVLVRWSDVMELVEQTTTRKPKRGTKEAMLAAMRRFTMTHEEAEELRRVIREGRLPPAKSKVIWEQEQE